ncbi:hypothetical protein RRG08_037387 [Elysia crispata]|uniref:Uncharacterized protein n=1 Tax=Elysia crispata TaxID=231223 RepID=A0AAE1AFZ5_9GAST|nr:hypothetical protein RRG08_037387 [Elysia crispata]
MHFNLCREKNMFSGVVISFIQVRVSFICFLYPFVGSVNLICLFSSSLPSPPVLPYRHPHPRHTTPSSSQVSTTSTLAVPRPCREIRTPGLQSAHVRLLRPTTDGLTYGRHRQHARLGLNTTDSRPECDYT